MTREDTMELLMTMQAAYPNYHVADKTVAINTWHLMLHGYDKPVVMGALQAFILSDTKGFAPSIGQIVEKIQTTTQPLELNEMEAWDLVAKAVRNGNYGAEEEFEKLPPMVQKAVGSPGQIAKWAGIPSDELHTVGQSNFLRSYRAILIREKEQEKLPPKLRQLSVATVAALEDHAEPEEPKSEGTPMPEGFMEQFEAMLSGGEDE